MFTDFFANAACDLDQFVGLAIRVSLLQEAVSVRWIDMEEHRASQMFDVKRLEKSIPPLHPLICGRVQNERVDLWPAFASGAFYS